MLSYDGLKTACDSCCTLDTLDIRAIRIYDTNIHRKDSRIQLFYQLVAGILILVMSCDSLKTAREGRDSCCTLHIRANPIIARMFQSPIY